MSLIFFLQTQTISCPSPHPPALQLIMLVKACLSPFDSFESCRGRSTTGLYNKRRPAGASSSSPEQVPTKYNPTPTPPPAPNVARLCCCLSSWEGFLQDPTTLDDYYELLRTCVRACGPIMCNVGYSVALECASMLEVLFNRPQQGDPDFEKHTPKAKSHNQLFSS